MSQPLRTTGTADPELGRRLGDFEFKVHRPLSRLLASAGSLALTWFFVRLFMGPASGQASFAERLGHAALAGVLLFVIAAVLIAVVVGIKFVAGRSKFTKLVPAGAPMSAEFWPQGFRVRVGNYQEQVELDKVTTAVREAAGLAVFTRVGDSKRKMRVVVVQRELVPPQIAEDYVHRFAAAS